MKPTESNLIERISQKEFKIRCDDGEWVTIKQYDKHFSEIARLFRVTRIVHGMACGCKNG